MKKPTGKTVLMTGGSGFLGTVLTKLLLDNGYFVRSIDVRANNMQHERLRSWQLDLVIHDLPLGILDGVDVIIHLAGEPIYGYWSKQKKQRIYDTRVKIARKLYEAIAHAESKPDAYISASAIGIYGDCGEHVISEEDQPGDDFLARVCMDWESQAKDIGALGVREVRLRTAPVLGQGGFLRMLRQYFKVGFGIWIGSGRQWSSWVHVDDVVRAYHYCIENEHTAGAYNVSAGACRQRAFMRQIGTALGRPVLFGVPKEMLQLRYGQLAEAMVASQHVPASERLLAAGYEFTQTDLTEALRSSS